jgi:hypothetical protein
MSEHAFPTRAALGDRAAECDLWTALRPDLREVQRNQPVGSTRGAKDQGAHDGHYMPGPSVCEGPVGGVGFLEPADEW